MKKIENGVKVCLNKKNALNISAIPPNPYAIRFVNFIHNKVLRPAYEQFKITDKFSQRGHNIISNLIIQIQVKLMKMNGI